MTLSILSMLLALSDNDIYEKTRQIVGAEMQNVVYGQYLTSVLGGNLMSQYNLDIQTASNYDENLDPSIKNAFATAAFRLGKGKKTYCCIVPIIAYDLIRFGHSMIIGLIKSISQSGATHSYQLRNVFFELNEYLATNGQVYFLKFWQQEIGFVF